MFKSFKNEENKLSDEYFEYKEKCKEQVLKILKSYIDKNIKTIEDKWPEIELDPNKVKIPIPSDIEMWTC